MIGALVFRLYSSIRDVSSENDAGVMTVIGLCDKTLLKNNLIEIRKKKNFKKSTNANGTNMKMQRTAIGSTIDT